ncbi:MAG: branched-chain amino acid ABC transporter permease [Anaerolineae bacterium]|jgi:branched-chain amino acid transport system permease protein
MTFFLQNLVNALQWGSFYALIALGYSMVYGVLLLFNFAHGDVFMVGAYVGFFVSGGLLALATAGFLALPVPVMLGLALVLTLIISMFLNSFVGMAVERIGYRPLRLRGAPRASAAITGLMLGIILEVGNLILLGPQRRKFPDELVQIGSTPIQVLGVSVTPKKIAIVLVSLALMYGLHLFVSRTKWGMAMRALAYDMARNYGVVPLMGVPIDNIALLTFAIGSGLAAAAGILFGIAYPVLDPYMGIRFGWKAFVAAILGGRGSILGACFAGFLLGFIEIFVAAFLPSTLRDLIAFSIVLIILTFRPHGLFGEAYTARLRL